ncbi:MAG: STAS domain-containing protein [Granulosicoccaceae bacterium]|jgi:phospholipid transport system transporter-binding protein
MNGGRTGSAKLERLGDGSYRLLGELSFASVPAVRRVGLETFVADSDIRLDLAGVSRADSAGLALLIEWLRYARQRNKTLHYLNMPPQMLAIARASSLDQILPLG